MTSAAVLDRPRSGPDPAGVLRALHRGLDAAAAVEPGEPTRDVPALAAADTDRAGIAFAPAAGAEDVRAGGAPPGARVAGARVVGAGDWQRPFSLQSVSKVFALLLLLARERDAVWSLFTAPGNEDHRSTAVLDPRHGRTPGPFTNAGALLVVDRLMAHHPDVAVAVRDLVATEALVAEPFGSTTVDEDVAASELASCHRNRALAHLLAERGLLTHPVEDVLGEYVRQCAVSATCRATALAAGLLARQGRHRDGRALVDPAAARRVNALMLTSGAYADSGTYALQVGVPLKTGVGGGVVAVVPRVGTLCAWSPGLDDVGTPRRALAAVASVVDACGLSVF